MEKILELEITRTSIGEFHQILSIKILKQNDRIITRGNERFKSSRTNYQIASSNTPELTDEIFYIRGTGQENDYRECTMRNSTEYIDRFLYKILNTLEDYALSIGRKLKSNVVCIPTDFNKISLVKIE